MPPNKIHLQEANIKPACLNHKIHQTAHHTVRLLTAVWRHRLGSSLLYAYRLTIGFFSGSIVIGDDTCNLLPEHCFIMPSPWVPYMLVCACVWPCLSCRALVDQKPTAPRIDIPSGSQWNMSMQSLFQQIYYTYSINPWESERLFTKRVGLPGRIFIILTMDCSMEYCTWLWIYNILCITSQICLTIWHLSVFTCWHCMY